MYVQTIHSVCSYIVNTTLIYKQLQAKELRRERERDADSAVILPFERKENTIKRTFIDNADAQTSHYAKKKETLAI